MHPYFHEELLRQREDDLARLLRNTDRLRGVARTENVVKRRLHERRSGALTALRLSRGAKSTA